MEREVKTDVINIMESTAPFLRSVKHFDGDDYICCAEPQKAPQYKLCDGSINDPVRIPMHCLCKIRPPPKPRLQPEGLHERDILFRPIRWRCKIPKKMYEKCNEPSLGTPIGLSKSSFSMYFQESKPSEQSLQGFATLLIAFAEYHITPEIEWDEIVINRILLEGQRLYNDSKTDLPEGGQMNEATIKRNFVLCENAFDIIVNDPFLIGHVIGQELPVPNLHWGLLKFFKKFQFCLLHIAYWYILLWKNADVYFVFDCFGRRTPDFRSDRKRGIAMLICLRNLDNVSHLILNLSGVQPDQLFTIRQLQIKCLIPCNGKPTPEIVDRSIQYEVISPDYALLRGTIHLGSKCFREIRHRHSLSVAICALINAKIDATPTWDSGVLNKIIKLGAEFYKQWNQCDISLDLGIQDIPNRFVFGQFMVQIAVTGITECGMWQCTPNYRASEITLSLRRAFERGSNLLVQIQGRSYALWKKATFYYILDPYSHKCFLGRKKIVTASVRMCGSIDKLCCIFTQVLLELFEESKFLIRLVKILQLEELDKMKENRRRAQVPCMCLATAQTDCTQEVVSINESVLGVGDYDCGAEMEPPDSDGEDLDSPGLSQTHMEDYTDLRRGFAEDSESESEEDESNANLEVASEDIVLNQDGNEDETDNVEHKKRPKKEPKKRPSKTDKAGGDASDANDDKTKGTKRGHETDDDKTSKKKKKENDEDDTKRDSKAEKDKIKKEDDKDKKKKKEDDMKEKDDKDKKKNEQTEKDQDKEKAAPAGEAKSTSNADESTPPRRQRPQRRKEQDGEDTSSDEKPCNIPPGCKPNSYPGFTEDSQDLAVVGSESGNYESLCSLLKSAFRCADRVLTMTPWGNYVAFHSNRTYFIFDGCTCNLRSIRHMDLSVGTAGLLCFPDMHALISYIESGKDTPKPSTSSKKDVIEQICSEYCGR